MTLWEHDTGHYDRDGHTSTVELDSRLEGNLLVNIAAVEGRTELLLGSVEAVDVGYIHKMCDISTKFVL